MIKLIILMKRREGLTHEEFIKYWKEEHGPLAMKTYPRIKKYVQNYGVKMNDKEPPYDGVVELWYDSYEDWKKGADDYNTTEAGKAFKEDEKKLLDRSKTVYIMVEENQII